MASPTANGVRSSRRIVVPTAAGDPPTLDALRDHVKASHPAFLAPKSLVLVDALPRTALGKLRRSTAIA